jgi:hypothetical protein
MLGATAYANKPTQARPIQLCRVSLELVAMLAPMLTIMGGIYEDPAIVALGPTWSAVAAGFAVVCFGEVYLTSAGEMYLQSIGGNQ